MKVPRRKMDFRNKLNVHLHIIDLDNITAITQLPIKLTNFLHILSKYEIRIFPNKFNA